MKALCGVASCARISIASTPPMREEHEGGDHEALAEDGVVDRREPAAARRGAPDAVELLVQADGSVLAAGRSRALPRCMDVRRAGRRQAA